MKCLLWKCGIFIEEKNFFLYVKTIKTNVFRPEIFLNFITGCKIVFFKLLVEIFHKKKIKYWLALLNYDMLCS